MTMTVNDANISDIELSKRILARRRLAKFIEYVDDRFAAMPPHVPLMCKELEEVVRYVETGQGTQILVLATPPRHLKTTTVPEYLTAWFHGRNPDKKVICTSYSSTLAEDSSRRVRDLIEASDQYRNLFGEHATTRIDDAGQPLPELSVSRDTHAADKWMLAGARGEHHAVGVGGTITGRGGNLIVIDDPTANRQEAESQLQRGRVIEFFRSTLFSRMERNGAIVIIMQLWHENDLVGWLKRVTDRDDPEYIPGFPPVKFVYLRAIAEEDDPLGRDVGVALWPQQYPRETLLGVKAAMGDYYFNAQYQQRPTAPEGNTFKRSWFPIVGRTDVTYKIQYWDTAEKDGQENDYWGGVTLGVTKNGIILIDVVYRKMQTAQGIEEICRFFDAHNSEQEPVSVVWVEAKSTGSAVVSVIRSGEKMIPIEECKVHGDKVARANTITGYCQARRIQLLQHSEWIPLFLDEISSFPTGAHDDLPDAFVGGVSKLVHGGFARISEAQRIEERRVDGIKVGTEYREKVFGRDGHGIKPRRNVLRKPPTV